MGSEVPPEAVPLARKRHQISPGPTSTMTTTTWTVRGTCLPACWLMLLRWCALCLGAFVGVLIRTSVSGLSISTASDTPSDTVIYAQVIGCVIMGFTVQHKAYLSRTRPLQLFYLCVGTGLCGSITTFSTFNRECNKHLFLQWDLTRSSSQSGAHVVAWLLCLGTGVVIPLAALHGGMHVALWSPRSNGSQWMVDYKEAAQENEGQQNNHGPHVAEAVLVCLYVAATAVTLFFWSDPMALAVLLGGVGAALRWLLGKLNPVCKAFPIGTFSANLLGTLVSGLVTLGTTFWLHFTDTKKLWLMYGMANGFCACLTTVSTWVNEINGLAAKSLRKAYIYCLVSVFASQLVLFLAVDIYMLVTVSSLGGRQQPQPICEQFATACSQFLVHTNCSDPVVVCSSPGSGRCACADWDAGELIDEFVATALLMDSADALVHVWPADSTGAGVVRGAADMDNPLFKLDLCRSFDRMCQKFLERLPCAQQDQQRSACQSSYQDFTGVCSCGDWDGSSHVLQATMRTLWQRTKSLMALPPTASMCAFQTAACRAALQHAHCPLSMSSNQACVGGEESELWSGTCLCGTLDLGVAATSIEMQIDAAPLVGGWCATYRRSCEALLDRIVCPAQARREIACGNSSLVGDFVGECSCGSLHAGDVLTRVLFGAVMSRELSAASFVCAANPSALALSSPKIPVFS